MTTLTVVPPVDIVCPPWCRLTQEEHREELRMSWEGLVHHISAPRAWATVDEVLRHDGDKYGHDGPGILIHAEDLAGTPAQIAAQAEHIIRDLRAAVATLQTA